MQTVKKKHECKLGWSFMYTTDGWKSVSKRSYHNHILVSVEGPIYLDLQEGSGNKAEAISREISDRFESLPVDVRDRILIGITDTPTYNQKAWRLLEAKYPKQFWIGCALPYHTQCFTEH